MATPIQEIQKVIDNIRHVLTQNKTTLSVNLDQITFTTDVEQALCNFFDSLKLPKDHDVNFHLDNAKLLTARLVKSIFQFLRREKIPYVWFCNNTALDEHLDTYAKELRDFIRHSPIIVFSLMHESSLNNSKYFCEILETLSENVSLERLEFQDIKFPKESFETLSLILSKSQIKRLHFISCTLYNDQFPRLVDQIQKIRSLKRLRLENLMFFDGLQIKTRKIVQSQLIELILAHPALSGIIIKMPILFCDFVLNEQLEYFHHLTKPNTGLEILSLNTTELNDDAVDLFVKILPLLPNLIEITFNQIALTYVNLAKVVAALEKHPKLQSIGFAIDNNLDTFSGGDDELAYPEHYDKAYARLLDLKQVKILAIPIAGIHSLQALERNQTLEWLFLTDYSKNCIAHSYFPFIDGLLPILQKNRNLLSVDILSPYREAEVRELMLRNNKLHRNRSRQSCIVGMSAAYGVKLLSRYRPFKDVFPLIFAFLGMPVNGMELYAKAKPDVRGKLPKEKLQKPELIPVGSKTVRMLDEGEVLKLYEAHCDAAQPHQRLQNGESYPKKRRIELHPGPITPAFSAMPRESLPAEDAVPLKERSETVNSGGAELVIDMDIADDDKSTSAFSADPKNYRFSFADFS